MVVFPFGRKGHGDCASHGALTPDDVLGKTFTVRKLGTGYDPDEVDEYLDFVADSMAGFAPPVAALDIRMHEFGVVRKRNSFDVEAVDEFLECIARTLEGRAGGFPDVPM